jgi:hypothetical protein
LEIVVSRLNDDKLDGERLAITPYPVTGTSARFPVAYSDRPGDQHWFNVMAELAIIERRLVKLVED